ncbi:MAG: hypothetical protein NWF13_06715 [Candidatus Bathyarchaeota archaeon]|nr:hypothetical protein [Candidatus Bathyarchaeota archaeon]
MVKQMIKVRRLFGWSRSFDVDRDENVLRIIAFVGDMEYHITPTPETVNRLKAVRNKIIQLMNQDIEVEGDVLEVWEKQQVTMPERVIEAFVRIQ